MAPVGSGNIATDIVVVVLLTQLTVPLLRIGCCDSQQSESADLLTQAVVHIQTCSAI